MFCYNIALADPVHDMEAIFHLSPLDDQGKKKSFHPRGTKVVIYHLVGNFMLNSMQNVVSLATCAESL